jgi:hypothetical protein
MFIAVEPFSVTAPRARRNVVALLAINISPSRVTFSDQRHQPTRMPEQHAIGLLEFSSTAVLD